MAKGLNGRQVRLHNEALVLDLIQRYQPISRYEVAELSGLTPATISTQVSQLLSMGVVTEGSSVVARGLDRGGRRPIPLSVVPGSRLAGGLLVNRTGVEGVVVDLSGTLYVERREDWSREVFEYSPSDIGAILAKIKLEMLKGLSIDLVSNLIGWVGHSGTESHA